MAETLPTLPDVQFVDADAQAVISTIMQSYTQHTGRVLADGDPVRQWLLGVAYIIALQRAQINDSARSNLLYYARGPVLDHLAFMRKVVRLPAEPARCTLRFQISASRLTPTTIPAGTRATADNQLYWQTTKAVVIPAGQSTASVAALALTPGAVGNAVAVGDVQSLVDPVAFIASVTNTTAGQGGRDAEDDDALRYRVWLAPAAFSTCGPVDGYKYWAYTAHADIADVLAHSPTAGTAEIRPLLTGGVIPDQAILDAVEAAVSAKDRRPLADLVTVDAPEAVPYDIAATWYLRRADQPRRENIEAAVAQARADYIAWQRGKLGRDIDPGELNARLRAAGVKRVAITSPVFTQLDAWEVAQEDDVTLTFGGVEDD